MLSPGTGLSTFGQLYNLRTTKLQFPHCVLKTYSDLDRTSLPEDRLDYFDKVRQEIPSQAEVDEMRSYYERKGFKNLREYGLEYLRHDVAVLGWATLRFFNELWDIGGVHPVDSGRFSAASYSDASFKHFLLKRKFPSNFCPTNQILAPTIQKACAGGICEVSRHAVNASRGEPAINSHLYPRNNNLAECLFYFDACSLYLK